MCVRKIMMKGEVQNMATKFLQEQGKDDAAFGEFGEIDSRSVSEYLVAHAEMPGRNRLATL